MDIVAEGLVFPEGPVVMSDGSVIVVEIMAGRVTRCWNGRTETVCETGGGPNGAAIGPDGALWVCNNGRDADSPLGEGWIERIDLGTGRTERVYDACEGKPLHAPNDLVFDASGRLWFTAHGNPYAEHRPAGGLFAASSDGSSIVAVNRRAVAYNGVGLSPDQSHVYVADTLQARVYRYENRAEAQQPHYIATAPGPVGFDSLAVTAAGNICVATIYEGAISTFTPEGQMSKTCFPDETYVTNIAFGGADMRDAYVTLSGTGRLARLRWDEPGLSLAFNG
ncbi:gluconolactonase [Novosphingobium sp. PhB165]|uniref:SMP-30/gluconolactonase/LRE family protein n=1 Tax=Novosphingobium sp. PhB165 TaxID=2485105 RepID=UPI001052D874|nr:SMP-30/gluconolactonase/LRE family protein [Novosphingobium sp. PhB165]TCM16610.1 gluconolactonase [Novosphingobium sp. PhB165]